MAQYVGAWAMSVNDFWIPAECPGVWLKYALSSKYIDITYTNLFAIFWGIILSQGVFNDL